MQNNDKKVLLRISNLKQYFPLKGGRFVKANDGITLDIYEGETFGLVGESGCGKSTLGRTILQLYHQTYGRTMYYGRSLDDLAPKYVIDTGRNLKSRRTKLRELEQKRDKLEADYAKLSEKEQYAKHGELDTARKLAEDALLDITKIVGGFLVVDDLDPVIAAYSKDYAIARKLSSMEENAIREGFANLKPSTEYDALYNAALCRERADWMVGINASRLFSCLYGQPLAVGRVMTPVLAMTVVREAAIAAFTPEKFYTVDLELTSGCTASSRRIPEKSVAENLLKACRKEMVATIQRITRKEKSENPPPLYDLTTLQRDANRLLGYSAQQTLDYVQSLYEKKLTTYPRTDSCYITDDDEEMLEELTEELEGFLDIAPEDVDEAVPRTRRTVNREKVTDHHAILPTRSMLQADLDALPKGERNVLKLIIARTLMAVSKPFRYLETMLTTECAGEEFTAKGKEVLEEGWKAVERKVLADILNRKQELTALPNAAENECGILNAELKEGQTSPPKHFTEDLLLHAMETASADSMPEGVERQGIGTPATRAATIEKLVQKGFLERKGTKKTKVLLPTDKGKALITVMPEEIQSPEMTADWETKLLQIERGEMEPSEFMTEINTMITELVKNTEMKKGANALMKSKIIGVCPNCGKPVVEREKGWFCENRECRFVLWKDNAFFKRLGKRLDAHVADKLLRDGRVRLKDCKSAKGKTYNATVLLSCEADGRSRFSLEFEGGC